MTNEKIENIKHSKYGIAYIFSGLVGDMFTCSTCTHTDMVYPNEQQQKRHKHTRLNGPVADGERGTRT